MPADCRAVPHFVDAPEEVFAEGNWHRVVAHKFEALERAFREEPDNHVFVMSDVDIRFYRPFTVDIVNRMRGIDVLFQRNRPSLRPIPRNLCTGFMVIRNTPRSRSFFRRAHAHLRECDRPGMGDQNACITLLRERSGCLGFGFLPTTYWSPGSALGRWRPGLRLSPPDELILHHANHTIGIGNKIQQLMAVEAIQTALGESSAIPGLSPA